MKFELSARRLTFYFLIVMVFVGISSNATAQPGWILPESVTHSPGVANPPSAAMGGMHKIDIIYTGNDRTMYHQWSTGGALNIPVDIGFVGSSLPPSVVANGRHKLDVFYRGADEHLWTRWVDEQGKWTPGVSLGGDKLTSAPFALANGLHKLDVFYAGTDGKLYLSWWDGGQWWSAPEKLSDEVLMRFPAGPQIPAWMVNKLPRRPPVAVVNGPHKVDVIYVVSQTGKTYGKLRTVWSQGPNSTLIGSWSLPMNVNGPSGPDITNSTFVDSALAASYGLAIDGKKRAHLFFTETIDSASHRGYMRHVVAEEGQNWVDNSTGLVHGGPVLSAVTTNEVFLIAPTRTEGDQVQKGELARTCYLKNPGSGPEKAVNCLQLP